MSAPADLTRLLPQLANGETFNRELEQLVKLHSRAGSNEDGTQRYQPVENLLASVRDGLRLVEQSLAHSLLQRASVGLQQETQQPPSLSFALPVIDQQEVKPLWIELHQRGKATSDGEQSWDVRLTFEFGDLGPVSCHVFLQGFRIAASFYSDWTATQESIESALPQLRQQLVAAGFDPGEMHSFPGNMAPAADSVAEFVESLIDIEV